jgi:hypothetical protein
MIHEPTVECHYLPSTDGMSTADGDASQRTGPAFGGAETINCRGRSGASTRYFSSHLRRVSRLGRDEAASLMNHQIGRARTSLVPGGPGPALSSRSRRGDRAPAWRAQGGPRGAASRSYSTGCFGMRLAKGKRRSDSSSSLPSSHAREPSPPEEPVVPTDARHSLAASIGGNEPGITQSGRQIPRTPSLDPAIQSAPQGLALRNMPAARAAVSRDALRMRMEDDGIEV